MIKFIFVVKRKPDISSQEFRKRWHDAHFVSLVTEVGKLLGASDFHMSLVLDVDFNKELNAARGVEETAFDAMMEYVLPSSKDLNVIMESDAFKEVFAELEKIEAEFIDFHHSQRCFIEHHDPIIP